MDHFRRYSVIDPLQMPLMRFARLSHFCALNKCGVLFLCVAIDSRSCISNHLPYVMQTDAPMKRQSSVHMAEKRSVISSRASASHCS